MSARTAKMMKHMHGSSFRFVLLITVLGLNRQEMIQTVRKTRTIIKNMNCRSF